MNSRACLEKVQKKDKMPIEATEELLKGVIDYLERSKDQTTQGDLLDAIDKLTIKIGRSHEKIEENTTVIRNSVTELSSTISTSPSTYSSKASPRSWATVASAASTHPKAHINKETEVIVRLNDTDKKQELKGHEISRIASDINNSISQKDITTKGIRAVKKLPSGDIAIHTVNAEEAEKLRNNSSWTTVLGKKAKTVLQTHAVMINSVETKKFDLITPEGRVAAIKSIKEDNEDIESLKDMEIVYISWRTKSSATQEYNTMVIEVTTPEMGNSMLDNSLVIGGEIRACSVFNKACRTIQCFKCYHHGHTTIQCTKEERCGHCAGEHSTRSKACPPNAKVVCCVCKGPHKPWMKICPEKAKEIQRILYQVSITPSRFLTQTRVTVNGKPTTDDEAYGVAAMEVDAFESQSFQGIQHNEAQLNKDQDKRRKNTAVTTGGLGKVPDLSQGSQNTPRGRGTTRSASPAKEKPKGFRNRNEEADKGGNYSAVNRAPLGEVSSNVGTRSSLKQ